MPHLLAWLRALRGWPFVFLVLTVAPALGWPEGLERYLHDDDEDEPQDLHGPPQIMYPSEYKSGTHLAAQLMEVLQHGVRAVTNSKATCAEELGVTTCTDRPLRTDYVWRNTRGDGDLDLDPALTQRLRRRPQDTAVLFYRDPVEMLASAYLYSRDPSECAARIKEWGECDLRDGITPEAWTSVADGLKALAGNESAMGEVCTRMDHCFRAVEGLGNAMVVWMDEILLPNGSADAAKIAQIFRFSLRASGGSPWEPPARWLEKLAGRAATEVGSAVRSGGLHGNHVHGKSDREVVVEEVEELAQADLGVRYFVKLRHRWLSTRDARLAERASGETRALPEL